MAKLESYKGSIELISGITQANNKDFALIDASAVQTKEDGTRLDAELETLKEQVDNLSTPTVTPDKVLISDSEGKITTSDVTPLNLEHLMYMKDLLNRSSSYYQDADNVRYIKPNQAAYADYAEAATCAINDGEQNSISETYAKKDDLTTGNITVKKAEEAEKDARNNIITDVYFHTMPTKTIGVTGDFQTTVYSHETRGQLYHVAIELRYETASNPSFPWSSGVYDLGLIFVKPNYSDKIIYPKFETSSGTYGFVVEGFAGNTALVGYQSASLKLVKYHEIGESSVVNLAGYGASVYLQLTPMSRDYSSITNGIF